MSFFSSFIFVFLRFYLALVDSIWILRNKWNVKKSNGKCIFFYSETKLMHWLRSHKQPRQAPHIQSFVMCGNVRRRKKQHRKYACNCKENFSLRADRRNAGDWNRKKKCYQKQKKKHWRFRILRIWVSVRRNICFDNLIAFVWCGECIKNRSQAMWMESRRRSVFGSGFSIEQRTDLNTETHFTIEISFAAKFHGIEHDVRSCACISSSLSLVIIIFSPIQNIQTFHFRKRSHHGAESKTHNRPKVFLQIEREGKEMYTVHKC